MACKVALVLVGLCPLLLGVGSNFSSVSTAEPDLNMSGNVSSPNPHQCPVHGLENNTLSEEHASVGMIRQAGKLATLGMRMRQEARSSVAVRHPPRAGKCSPYFSISGALLFFFFKFTQLKFFR